MLKYIIICSPNSTGEYKTEVREEDVNERPILGQSKSLICYNSEENTGNPLLEKNAVRWIHNGLSVQNDDRHNGASTRVFKVLLFRLVKILNVSRQIESCVLFFVNMTLLTLPLLKLQHTHSEVHVSRYDLLALAIPSIPV